jgi:hypothetical protein
MMKNKLFLSGIISLALIFGLAFTGCSPTTDGGGNTVTQYTVSFDGGDGEGDPPASKKVDEGGTITLPDEGDLTAPAGKEFDGWKADGTGTTRRPGYAYTVTKNVEFVAQWKDTNPDPGPAPQTNPLVGTWFFTDFDDDTAEAYSFTANNIAYGVSPHLGGAEGYAENNCRIQVTNADSFISTGRGTLNFQLDGTTLSTWWEGGDDVITYNKRIDGTSETGNPARGIWINDAPGNRRELLVISKVISGSVKIILGTYVRTDYTLSDVTGNSGKLKFGTESPLNYEINATSGTLRIAYSVGNIVEFKLATAGGLDSFF